jgi:hypothetical protein
MMSSEAATRVWEKSRFLIQKHGQDSLPAPAREDVRRLLLIQSASRSGSSLLFHLLSGLKGFVSTTGEETPFYRLSGIGKITSFDDSDEVAPETVSPEGLERLATGILEDVGESDFAGGKFPSEDYALDCALRLMLQWPGVDFDPEELFDSARALLAQPVSRLESFRVDEFWSVWLTSLSDKGHAVDFDLYDLPSSKNPRSRIPPALIEEPPFVIPRPRRRARSLDLRNHTLVLKSSSNCYRLPLLKKLFPSAEIKLVLLSRNPAAAINGLMDGWVSSRFHSHDLSHVTELRIGGYSVDAESRSWWKFDLPPGWAAVAHSPLEEVCSFQWGSANRSMLSQTGLKTRYEDFLSPDSLRRQIRRILDFADIAYDPLTALKTPPVVMAVNPPREGKWRNRQERILSVIQSREVSDLAARLGYDVRDWEKFS